ncbi:MAG: EAL domain-containing protein [Butyrivibrio sp.]|nr:EAL domain-containing protein [Butyrivibrio sp.]
MDNIIVYFDYCALAIVIVLLIALFIRKSTKGSVNKLYILLNVLLVITAISNIISNTINNSIALREKYLLLEEITLYIYFALRNSTVVIYLVFLYHYMHMGYKFDKLLNKILLFIPYFILLIALFTNPVHHKIFSLSVAEGYNRGDYILILYCISMLYMFYGIYYLIRVKRFVTMDKWFALESMYFLTFVAVIIQFIRPEMAVELLSTAISWLLIMLIVHRPEEIIDFSVDLSNWSSYKNELLKITSLKRNVTIIALQFVNASRARSYLGEEYYNSFIKRVAKEIHNYLLSRHKSYEIYYEAPKMIYVILNNKITVNFENSIKQIADTIHGKTTDIRENGITLDARVCAIRYPEDLKTSDEIIHMGHEFTSVMPFDKKFVFASELVNTSRYNIGNQLGNILNHAIKNNSFEMYYQPIYSVKDNSFKSAEALIRLNDESFGMISPGYFIPFAEKRGLIIAIGDQVLEMVFKFIYEHKLEDLGLSYIELNLSVAQCMQSDLPDKFKKLQERYNVKPSQINLEILETTYDEISLTARKNIDTLTKMGYTFSLDDYGTGYSNVQRVSTLPLSIIKIDKSLTDCVLTENGQAIVSTTIKMMKEIGKEIVAEGVEDEDTLELLKEMGTDYIQGYIFSKPLPKNDFIRFLKINNKGTM